MNVETILKQVGNKLEHQVLLATVLKLRRVDLHIHPEKEMKAREVSEFLQLIEELHHGAPLSYLTGVKEWMGLDFKVERGVLIPREDTRILLEAILDLKSIVGETATLMEIGTGSGILPTLLKKSWGESQIYTVEKEATPLRVSRENFSKHQVKIISLEGDLVEPLVARGVNGEILFSNPPYISLEEFEDLDISVKKEPYEALVGEENGLEFYYKIAHAYPRVLKKNGFVVVEIGYQQGASVRRIFEERGLTFLKLLKDDGNRDRVIVCQRKG